MRGRHNPMNLPVPPGDVKAYPFDRDRTSIDCIAHHDIGS
jgi:hypothetical protein